MHLGFHRSELKPNSPVVHFSQENATPSTTITIIARTETDNWEDILHAKQELSAESKTIITIIKNLKHSISIDYQTPREKRQQVPDIVRNVINADPDLSMICGRLSSLSEYSLDFTFSINSSHTDSGEFFDSIATMKEGILFAFEDNNIDIPFPTSIEIQRHSPSERLEATVHDIE